MRDLSVCAPCALFLVVMGLCSLLGLASEAAACVGYLAGIVMGFIVLLVPGLATEDGVDPLYAGAGGAIWFIGVPMAAITK